MEKSTSFPLLTILHLVVNIDRNAVSRVSLQGIHALSCKNIPKKQHVTYGHV